MHLAITVRHAESEGTLGDLWKNRIGKRGVKELRHFGIIAKVLDGCGGGIGTVQSLSIG
jgi:hypothetical protein